MKTFPGTDKQAMSESRIEIRQAWCKGCEFCVSTCPHDVLRMDGITVVVEHPEKCTDCELCVWICPDFAIQLVEEDKARQTPTPSESSD